MMQQPLPTCTQTLRQRIAEFTQLLATILYKKQMYSSPREAAREVWSRLLLKIKHSSSRKDIPLLRGNRLRQYDVDVLAWEAAGRPKGQKPLKKDYDWNNNQWIEFLSIEFEALTCAFAVARDFGI
jgi:hypothetical protein